MSEMRTVWTSLRKLHILSTDNPDVPADVIRRLATDHPFDGSNDSINRYRRRYGPEYVDDYEAYREDFDDYPDYSDDGGYYDSDYHSEGDYFDY
jgi:hypothetical protein